MRRTLTVFLIATTILIGAPVTAQARNGHPPCDGRRVRQIHPALGIPEVQARVRLLIKCAVRRFPVSGGRTTAYCIANRESSFWPYAVGPGGYSVGVYQIVWPTFLSWWRTYDRVRNWIKRAHPLMPLSERRYDPYANVMLGVRAMHDSTSPWSGGSYAC